MPTTTKSRDYKCGKLLSLLFFFPSMVVAARHSFTFSYERFLGGRFLELPKSSAKDRFQLDHQMQAFGWLHIDQELKILTEPYHVAFASYALQPSVEFFNISLFYRHESGHSFDSLHPLGFFPVQDSIGLKYKLSIGEIDE